VGGTHPAGESANGAPTDVPPTSGVGLPSEGLSQGRFQAVLSQGDLTIMAVLVILYISSSAVVSGAGAAALPYWLLGFLTFLLPSAIITGKLARMFPGEGAFYLWVHKALGPFWDTLLGFFCFWWPPILIVIAAGTSIAGLVQALGASFGQGWLIESWQQGLVSIGTLVLIWLVARRPLSFNRVLMRWGLYLYLGLIGLMGLAVVYWLVSGHQAQTNFSASHFSLNSGNLTFYSTVILACLGLQMPLNMGREVQGTGATTRYLPRSVLLVVGGYLISWLALAVILPQDPLNPLSASNQGNLAQVFTVALGGSVVGQVVGAAATLGFCVFFVVSGAVYLIVQSRLLVMMALDQRLPRRLAKLDKAGVPRAAHLTQFLILLVFMIVVFVVAPALFSQDANFQAIISNLIPASTVVLWAISALTLFLVGAILVARYPTLAQRVGGASPALIWGCAAFGTLATLAAIWLVFTAPWTPLLSPGDWAWWVALLVLGSLAVGAIYSFLAPEPEDIWFLWARSKRSSADASKRS
jgi:amino acid transporter